MKTLLNFNRHYSYWDNLDDFEGIETITPASEIEPSIQSKIDALCARLTNKKLVQTKHSHLEILIEIEFLIYTLYNH
jgi:hypothetical protein